MRRQLASGMALATLIAPAAARAQEGPFVDGGDTAWLLAAAAFTALVALPGLALFHGGQVRARNVLSVFAQGFIVAALASILWAMIGYSMAFSPGTGLIGGLGNAGLGNLAEVRDGTAVPESAFALFEMALAMLAPVLIVGAFSERVRLGWLLPFMLFWTLIVHAPIVHWIWGGGWLAGGGTLDHGGGLVMLVPGGCSALVLTMIVGHREPGDGDNARPHGTALSLAGAGLLWVGWLGLAGGAALAASNDAALAMINTHLAAAAAGLCWSLLEWISRGKASVTGFASGAVAGLAASTAASGYIGPMGGLMLGVAAAPVCMIGSAFVRRVLRIDDANNVFALFGLGGATGAVLLAPLALSALGGVGYAGDSAMIGQLVAQIIGLVIVALWSAFWSLVIGLGLSLFIPMRVGREAERSGLDHASHGESGWDFN